ncbi:M23 family metallopeptidase [Streptomyces sp. NRRL F-5126]|uniref:M23 family metallopeptidase n=1 Tax=Streptomyces sp. NRRL F-5126 TaxID=1463857 RepID=UPI0004C5DF6C|nr:LysM peptidoglycan-binding domain-containing M23 family metallopeptidase [Streptomyces sp. NRRL F-5126]
MPARGKHRRPRNRSLTRGLTAVGTGGAAVVLPLLGAASAGAAEHTAPAAKAGTTAAATSTYTVAKGDTLASIAVHHHVSGGWKALYRANKDVVGADPSLIRPGEKLRLGSAATPAGTAATGNSAHQASATTGTGWMLPAGKAPIGTPYHAAGSMWSSGYHTGTDFLVDSGTPVHAVAAGTVVTAGWGGSYGNQVVIRHDDGHYSQYGHLSSLSVSAGQSVTEGEQIGLSGATGNVTGPHLHFEIRTGPDYGSDIDPMAFLQSHGVTI